MIYLGDVMLSLSYLLGENTVPNTGTQGRQQFIKDTLKEVYHAYPWKFAEALATLSVTASGIASLPSDFSLSHLPYVKYYQSDGVTATDLDLANEEDQEDINIGDNKYWISSLTNDNQYILNTKEVISSVVVKYQRSAPDIAASVGTPFNSSSVLALGARRYYRIAQDPEADISQEEALFQKRLQETIAAVQVSAPRKKRRTKLSDSGWYTGAE